jgi:hypothetical protein
MPSGSIESIEIDGRDYSILGNVNGVLAVVRDNGDGSWAVLTEADYPAEVGEYVEAVS